MDLVHSPLLVGVLSTASQGTSGPSRSSHGASRCQDDKKSFTKEWVEVVRGSRRIDPRFSSMLLVNMGIASRHTQSTP